jgi:hypothetical protein
MLGGGSKAEGPIIFRDNGPWIELGMELNHPEYPADGFGYDGRTTLVHRFPASNLSGFGQVIFPELGYFLGAHDRLLQDGLFGGVLRTSWALLFLDPEKDKLRYRGLKKKRGRELHLLEYKLAKVQDGSVTVMFYFEPDTYRHVLTKYNILDTRNRLEGKMVATGSGGSEFQGFSTLFKFSQSSFLTPGSEIGKRVHDLEEHFSDFRKVDGLDLPLSWSVRLRREIYPFEVSTDHSQNQRVTQWQISLSEIRHPR